MLTAPALDAAALGFPLSPTSRPASALGCQPSQLPSSSTISLKFVFLHVRSPSCEPLLPCQANLESGRGGEDGARHE